MASLMDAPRLSQNQEHGRRRSITEHRDGIEASDHLERTEFSVEGDGPI
jgi:hypothetical protein